MLHTRDQRLQHHPHVCTAWSLLAALAPEHTRWISSCQSFFSSRQGAQPCLSRQVRRCTQDGLPRGYAGSFTANSLRSSLIRTSFASWLRVLFRQDWCGLFQAALRWTGTRVALSRKLHSPRCHLQPPAACARRWQGRLPMRRDSAHGNRKRESWFCLSTSSSAASCSMCCHTASCASATWLPRQSATSRASAAVFTLAPTFNATDRERGLVGHALHWFAMQVPRLWWNYACRRATLQRTTPPTISPSSLSERSLKSHLQPRTLLVQRHVQPLYALLFSDRTLAHRSRPSDAYCHEASTYKYSVMCERTGSNDALQLIKTRLGAYKSHSLGGRLPSSRCIRSARR